jgi:hypothetical protein
VCATPHAITVDLATYNWCTLEKKLAVPIAKSDCYRLVQLLPRDSPIATPNSFDCWYSFEVTYVVGNLEWSLCIVSHFCWTCLQVCYPESLKQSIGLRELRFVLRHVNTRPAVLSRCFHRKTEQPCKVSTMSEQSTVSGQSSSILKSLNNVTIRLANPLKCGNVQT